MGIPEELEQLGIAGRLEVRDLERVVRVGVHAKVLDLRQWDRLVVRGAGAWRRIALGVRAERADVNAPSRDRTVRVNDDGEEWVFPGLVRHLGLNVDAREPAAVARVRVVPANDVLKAANLLRRLDVLDHELVRLVLAFTRVSVPVTGSANASMTTMV